MRVLVIDNYDSFTYNLVQYLGELGAEVLVRRNDEVTPEEVSELHPDRIVVSPGPCTPNEAGISVDLIGQVGERIPTLGVCLGHQAIGQAFGARDSARRARPRQDGEDNRTTAKGSIEVSIRASRRPATTRS